MKTEILDKIDKVLGDNRVVELDAMLDRVFPPGEERHVTPERLAQWQEDNVCPCEVCSATPEAEENLYPPMVNDYQPGSDRRGEVADREFGFLTSDPLTLWYPLGRIGRSPRRRDGEDWRRLRPGHRWIGYLVSYGFDGRARDRRWLAAEDRWLEEHSEP